MTGPVDPQEPKFAAGGEVAVVAGAADADHHGCTLFIPRAGDPKRFAAILELARRWYQGEGEAS